MGPGTRPFYKYASAATTLVVLETGNVRYSSPLAFNDPFDVQSGLHFDFDLSTLHDKVLDRMELLASATAAPQVDPNDVWGKIVLLAHQHFPKHGFDKERWRALTADSFRRMEDVLRDTQQKYQSHWREKLLPGVRVFCVSEERDNLLMWAHYTGDHQGAVLELWSLPEEDNPLSVAEPVEYMDRPPPFYAEADWLDDLVGIKKLDFTALYRRYAYAKSSHWAYEKEWRIWYPFSTTDRYDDAPINPKELKAIYIGCRASPGFREAVINLVAKKFPATRVLVASKSKSEYTLQYTDA